MSSPFWRGLSKWTNSKDINLCCCLNWTLSCFSEKLKTSTTTESGQNPDKLWPGMLTYSYACACYNVDHCSCELTSLKKSRDVLLSSNNDIQIPQALFKSENPIGRNGKKNNLNWTYEDPKWNSNKTAQSGSNCLKQQ